MKRPSGGLMQRIGNALAAARRGFPVPVDHPTTGGFLVNLGLNNLDIAPIQTKSDQLDAYVGWVHAAAGKIAEDLRANPRAVWKKAGERREDWEEVPWPELPQLFRRPNTKPNQDTWGKFVELRNLHKDITGEAWWHLITAGAGGRAEGVELIQPDHIDEPVFNANHTEITAWWVDTGNVAGGRRQIDARDLVLDFYPNPRDPLRGSSPIEGFALAHHMDIYLRAYGVKVIRDGAAIGEYVSVEKDLDATEAEGIESRLWAKHRTPGRIAVFGGNAKVHTLPLPLNDLNMLRLLRPSRDQILAMYGVPASMLGLTEGAGDTNQSVAERAYKKNALLRRARTFDEIMNETVMPRIFGAEAGDLFYESENPVESDQEWEFERAEKKLKAGAIKVNHFLQEIGDEEIGDDGEVYFVPSQVRVVRSLAAISETEPPDDDDAESGGSSGTDDGAETEAAVRTAAERITAAALVAQARENGRLRRDVAAEAFLRSQEREERALKSEVRRLFSKEQREVKRQLRENESQVVENARSWEPAVALLPADVVAASVEAERLWSDLVWRRDWLDEGVEATTEEWNTSMAAAVRKSTRSGWSLLQQEVAGALDFGVFDRKASEFASRTAASKVRQIQTATVAKIRDVIRKAVEEGASIDTIAKRIDTTYDGFRGARAETIARTETARAINYGKFSAAKESKTRLGMDIRRNWLATADERTRETHANADSDVNETNRDLDVDTPYEVGAARLWHPGDPAGPPEETVNCRCLETFRDVGLEQ